MATSCAIGAQPRINRTENPDRFVFISISSSFERSGLIEMKYREQIRMDNPRCDSQPACIFQPSLSQTKGRLLRCLIACLLQIEVSVEHLAAIQCKEQSITTCCAWRFPVVNKLVRPTVIAQTRPTGHTGLKYVNWVTVERAA